jgi:hypothetical protein
MNKRQYKKRYAICEDDNGKMIYAGDTVELWIPMETKNPHQSIVYFNMLDGAYVESSPAHDFMNNGKRGYRKLSGYLNQKAIPIYDYEKEEPEYKKGYCIKVKSFYEE